MKSYKVTFATRFDIESGTPVYRSGQQMPLPTTVPGPQTRVDALGTSSKEGFENFNIFHEYRKDMAGRSLDTGEYFASFIAQGEIKAYLSRNDSVLLMSGKKADVLDFCRHTDRVASISLETIEIDMNALQEKLPSVRGVWFRLKKGLIRAKALIGDQLQDTSEFCDAKADGQISTLSFYFDSIQDGCAHPLQITQDGTIVLQKTYKTIAEEIEFVMQVKRELLDEIFTKVPPSRARAQLQTEVVLA